MKLNITNKSGQFVKAPKSQKNGKKPTVVKGGDLRSK